MPFVNAGRDHFLDAIIGVAVTAFNAANARMGFGDSSTAFSTAHTDLQAATNKIRKAVDSAPSRSTNVLTFVATLATGDANWAGGVQELGIFNAAAAGTMLARYVANMGVKVNTQTWVVTYTLTVTV
jgi:hypothetical protein